VYAGEAWTESGFTLALFQGWGVGSEVVLEQVQLNFSFRNKFIILLPCGLLVDSNTFSKTRIFKSYWQVLPASNNEIHMLSFSPI